MSLYDSCHCKCEDYDVDIDGIVIVLSLILLKCIHWQLSDWFVLIVYLVLLLYIDIKLLLLIIIVIIYYYVKWLKYCGDIRFGDDVDCIIFDVVVDVIMLIVVGSIH